MEESTRYLLVGGGLACVWAAQNIRERDKEGGIMIVGKEHWPPYDRPPLSKQSIADDNFPPDDAFSKFDNFYPDNNIDLRKGPDYEVTRIDRQNRAVTLQNGDTIRYEKLLLATGSDPRSLDVPGSDLREIYYLRTLDESIAIRKAMQRAKRVVFIGAGYLNMEVSSGALERGLDVTMIETTDRPWSRFASHTLGGFMRKTYEARGAKFVFNDSVTAFMGGGSVAAVTTKGGEQIETDMVVVSIGVTLNTDLAKQAGLEVGDRGGVRVDSHLQTSDPNIYAAGDIALFDDVALGKTWHAEHHLNAKWQGRAVGAIMAGERKPYDQVPYFFSDFLDLHMILRGDTGAQTDNTIVLGNLDGGEFVELYPDPSGVLRYGVAISHEEKNLDPISDKLEELIRAKASVRELSAGTFGM